jgi:class 3 adenylate cyclase/tetratricopeptide (TPR) repeat protein
MFCDLVGSTALAAAMDPEDWRELNSAYHKAVASAVEQYGGYVAQKMGDGAMIYFGYPEARENDAERAVRAGLAIHGSLAALSAGLVAANKPAVAARVGMHTGPVVVDGGAYVFGDVPNLAARVQSAAAPGEVLITAALHRHVAGLVVAEDRGDHALKGIAEPVKLLRVARVAGVRGRRVSGLSQASLVGRDEELAILRRRWERNASGAGQLVLVSGEAGLGKSRLVEEFRASLADAPHIWLDWSCAQLLQNSPFHPLVEWARQRFGGPEIDPARRLAELGATFDALGLDAVENIGLMALLLELPLPADYPLPKGSPAELRPKLLAALAAWFLAAARVQPVVLAVEDLHWADPSTLDLLRLLADQGAAVRLLLLVTARPEYRPGWASRSHHTHVNLAPLLQADAARIVGEIVTRHGLSPDEVATVVERSGGVPLFLEEVTRLLVEGDRAGARTIPQTLAASLTARLDRMGSAREVAQIGAVLGREFTWPLLRATAGMADEALRNALERLAESELLQAEGTPPDARYRFKHALIQEAAYESLLKSRRQKLHLLAAEALEATAAAPEILAHHFTLAGLATRAAAYSERAGDNAVARSSYTEAVAAYTAAIDGARVGAVDETGRRRLLALALKLGPALTVAQGTGSGGSRPAYDEAYRLSRELGDARAQFKAAWGLWLISAGNGDHRGMSARAEELAALSRHIGDDDLHYEATHCGWATAHMRGQVALALDLSRDGTERYRRERHAGTANQYAGHDPGVCAHSVHAVSLSLAGRVDQASHAADAAVALGQSLDHPHSLAHGLSMSAVACQIAGDRDRTARFAAELIALADRYGFPSQRLAGEFYSGWVRLVDGDAKGGLVLMESAFARRAMLPILARRIVVTWAESLLAAGRLDDAEAAVDQALADPATAASNEASGLWRVKGEARLARAGLDEGAEGALRQALSVAGTQDALLLELRAAASLARGLDGRAGGSEAKACLATLYGRFTEGFSTPHLRAAKATLEAVA